MRTRKSTRGHWRRITEDAKRGISIPLARLGGREPSQRAGVLPPKLPSSFSVSAAAAASPSSNIDPNSVAAREKSGPGTLPPRRPTACSSPKERPLAIIKVGKKEALAFVKDLVRTARRNRASPSAFPFDFVATLLGSMFLRLRLRAVWAGRRAFLHIRPTERKTLPPLKEAKQVQQKKEKLSGSEPEDFKKVFTLPSKRSGVFCRDLASA